MNEPGREASTDFGGICHSTLPLFAASSDVKANFRAFLACRYSKEISLRVKEMQHDFAIRQVNLR